MMMTQLEKDIVPKCQSCMFARPFSTIDVKVPLKQQKIIPFCDLKQCAVALDGLCEKWSLAVEVKNFVVGERLKSLRGGRKP